MAKKKAVVAKTKNVRAKKKKTVAKTKTKTKAKAGAMGKKVMVMNKKSALGNDPLAWKMDSAAQEAEPVQVTAQVPEKAKAKVEVASNAAMNAAGVLTVDLADDLSIGEIRTVADALKAVPTDSELNLNAEEVSVVDSAGIQLLLSWTIHLRKQNVAFNWSHVPDVLLSVAETLGVAETLQLKE